VIVPAQPGESLLAHLDPLLRITKIITTLLEDGVSPISTPP
jgi:hypothetical protein